MALHQTFQRRSAVASPDLGSQTSLRQWDQQSHDSSPFEATTAAHKFFHSASAALTSTARMWLLPLCALALCTVCSIVVLPIALTTARKVKDSGAADIRVLAADGSPGYLRLVTSVAAIDAVAGTVRLVTSVRAEGSYRAGNQPLRVVLPDPKSLLVIAVGGKAVDFASGADLQVITSDIALSTDAAPHRGFESYPFDVYSSLLSVSVSVEADDAPGANGTQQRSMRPVPFVFRPVLAFPQWSLAPVASEDLLDGAGAPQALVQGAVPVAQGAGLAPGSQRAEVFLALRVKRNHRTRLFSMGVVALMWALSSFIFVVAVDYTIVRPRRDGFNIVIISVCSMMMFALPSMRNVQPGIPPVGIMIDLGCFYWNVMLLALSALLLLLSSFFGTYRHRLMLDGSSSCGGDGLVTVVTTQDPVAAQQVQDAVAAAGGTAITIHNSGALQSVVSRRRDVSGVGLGQHMDGITE